MTWAIAIGAWWVLSVPIGCLAVRWLVPTASRGVGATTMFLSPTNSNSSARRAPKPSETPACVSFDG
jgi:hypothetical protein